MAIKNNKEYRHAREFADKLGDIIRLQESAIADMKRYWSSVYKEILIYEASSMDKEEKSNGEV